MLINIKPPRRRRVRIKSGSTSTPVGPLTLVAASYVDGVSLTLAFNQAIDASAFEGAAVFVNDVEITGNVYLATGPVTLINPTTIRVGLNEFEFASGSGITLTAPATTGIVAVDGGGTWAGVTNVELPFG